MAALPPPSRPGQVAPELLPERPADWAIVLAGELGQVAAGLAQDLTELGFGVAPAPTVEAAVAACRDRQAILLASTAWLAEHADPLGAAALFSNRGLGAGPLLVALTDTEDFRAQVKARRIGARLLLAPSVPATGLLSELAGLAWMPRKPYRIMLVDDDAAVLEFHAALLREAGCEVLAMDDPVAAWEFLDEFAPETCILDVEMPACRGTDLAALLRRDKRYARLPVIYLSAFADIEHQLDARHAGGEDYLVKPVDARLLVAAAMARARQFRLLEIAYRQRRQAYVEMQKAREAAEQADRAKSVFLAGWGHELRTPLNALLGHAQLLLLSDGVTGDAKEQVREIVQGGHRFARLIGDLLERIDTGAAQAAPPAAAKRAPAQAKPSGPRRRILVAEDNPANQAVLRMQLGVLGFDADIAGDGAVALAKWQAGGHDLILADRNMPVMDGLELTRAIRANEQETGAYIPIVAITAVQHAEELALGLAAGMDDALPKPIELDALRRILQRWLPQAAAPAPARPAGKVAGPARDSADLDLDYLVGIVGQADGKEMRELIDLFTTTAREHLPACRRCLAERNGGELAAIMHKLKSSARMVGALRYAGLAQNIEDAAKAGRRQASAALVAELELALDAVESAARDGVRLPPVRVEAPAAAPFPLPNSVLVVDDDPVACRQIALLLTSLGVRGILTVNGAEAALKEIAEAGAGFDLLISDINMPGMDGIQFLRHLAETGYRGGLILSSGVEDRLLHSTVEWLATKALDLRGALKKPVRREALLQALAEAGERRAAPTPKRIDAISPDAIRKGMRQDEFVVHFQPKVDAATLRVVGVEALARWQCDGRPVPPDAFIVAAERHDLIVPLSEMLLGKALAGGARLADMGFPLSVAVNLSANWLSDVRLPEFVLSSLQSSGFKAEHLILEITETGVMTDLATALDVMTRLRLKGFRLAIDDFGTGYSSLEQLQRIPFSELKLDRGFVRGAAEKPAARAILASTLEMAKKLKLTTVAEGVETQRDLDLVRGLGCDLVQGWFVAKAMAIDDLLAWLRHRPKIEKSI